MLMFYIVAKSLIINQFNKGIKEHFQCAALLKKGNMQSSGRPIKGGPISQPRKLF